MHSHKQAQKEVMKQMNNTLGKIECAETESRIARLSAEVDAYRQAIEDAENALQAAEQELVEELEQRLGNPDKGEEEN